MSATKAESTPSAVPQATADTRGRRAFIVRPFGEKKGIDFDRVESELISPALARLEIAGRTTADILRAGNIRTDMFHLLLVADIVIADLSIHNANVFYELGIRHALRRNATVLIRGRNGGDEIPFDLFTDRYFTYDENDPASSVDTLVRVLYDTIQSTLTDSPVFLLLPELVEQRPESFLAAPAGFIAEVERATAETTAGDLALFAEEIQHATWARVGLRAIGRAQFALRAMEAARDTWEAVRIHDENDIEANTLLATIYQKLGDLAQSDSAIERVLAHPALTRQASGEAWSLKARNAKARWFEEWEHIADSDKARECALGSGWLRRAFEDYANGFRVDLTNYYPGVNALAMLVIMIELADHHLQTWRSGFREDEEADHQLAVYKKRRPELTATVQASINAEQELAKAAGKRDLWADISEADLSLYRGDSAARVAGRYNLVRGISPFQVGAVRNQLEMFARLGIHAEAANAALETLPQAQTTPVAPHVLLFTGHRVDDPGRKVPRFPADKVNVARQEIGAAIEAAIARHGKHLAGISGAASGGDILFHQECHARGIPTTIYLALPKKEYAASSVTSAGARWIRDYYDLLNETPSRVLQQSIDLPKWLAHRDSYTVWQRSNLWMLHNALANGSSRVTLIALWNGQEGDGPGGTADMFNEVERRGGEALRIGGGSVFPAD
ncbi:MAG TPA: tetratricopeptide repeat-containing protein [Thermoanaerobaculia bacterium]